jgi:hypothetical protein
MEWVAVFMAQVVQAAVQLARPRVQMEPLTLAAVLAAVMEMLAIKAQVVQDLCVFATLTLLHLQHQQQDHQQSQHQAVTEFTNGQEAGA